MNRGVALAIIGPGNRVCIVVAGHLRRDVAGRFYEHRRFHKPRWTGRSTSLYTYSSCLRLFRDRILSDEREEAKPAGVVSVALLAVALTRQHNASLVDGNRDVIGRVFVSP